MADMLQCGRSVADIDCKPTQERGCLFALQVCVTIVPAPSFVLFTQLMSSAVMVKVMAGSNIVDAEPFQ